MKTLQYGELGILEILPLNFSTLIDLANFIESKMQEKKVFIFTFNTDNDDSANTEVIVTDNYSIIDSYLGYFEDIFDDEINTFFLQEYDSFEDAYSVALMMKEGNKLCYN